MATTTKITKKAKATPKETRKSTTKDHSTANVANGASPDNQQIPTMPITVHAQYIKDLSFETPGPFAQSGAEQPSINLNVEVRAEPKENGKFEVELEISAEARRNDSRVFVLQLTYAGLFSIGDVPEQHIPPILLIECPRLLFPFARNIVADATRDGGFPPLALSPVDFAEIYRRQVLQTQGNA
jgi:preprotein translocase subunit SecB